MFGAGPESILKFVKLYQDFGRYLIVLGVLFGSYRLAYQEFPRRLMLGFFWAVTSFLIFAPGFGIQYLLYPMTAAFAVNPRRAFIFSVHATLFLLVVYYDFLISWFPLESNHTHYFFGLSALLGISVWSHLVCFVFREFREQRSLADSAHT
jgi:hypothetical protein